MSGLAENPGARLMLAAPPLLSICVLALYFGTQVVLAIVVLYWLAIAFALTSGFFLRRHKGWWALSVAATIALLLPATQSALSWTAWSIGGFAP